MAITLLILAFVSILNWWRYRDVFYPAFAQSAVWLVLLVLLWVFRADFDPVHGATLAVVASGVVAFSLGCLVFTFGHRPCFRPAPAFRVPASGAALALLAVTGLSLPVVLFMAYQMATSGPTDLPFLNLRFAVAKVEEEAPGSVYGLFIYVFQLAYFSAALQVMLWVNGRQTRRVWVLAAILIALAYGVLSTGRSILIGMMMTLIMIPMVQRSLSVRKTLGGFVLLSGGLFIGLGWLMGKGGHLGLDASELLEILGDTFRIYLLSSVPALDHALQQASPLEMGENSFRSVFALLHAIGFDVGVRPLVQDFIDVPYSTNIYTLYLPYYKDFGWMALPLVQFVFGVAYGALYRAVSGDRTNLAAVFLFAYAFWPLLGQFGGDPYFSLLSQWVQVLALCLVFLVWLTRPVRSAAP